MKSLIVVLMWLSAVQANAFEVICSCEEPCKQVVFNVDDSDLGSIMTVNTVKSETTGPATVIESKLSDRTVYKLGSLVLIREGNSFKMLDSNRVCGLLVENR